MFEGGTNFGISGGGDDPPYMAATTSHDYDAPLNESGDVSPKYFAIRDIVSKVAESAYGHGFFVKLTSAFLLHLFECLFLFTKHLFKFFVLR